MSGVSLAVHGMLEIGDAVRYGMEYDWTVIGRKGSWR